MYSDMISKIDKAKRYAQEPERIAIQQFSAIFRGGNNHEVQLLASGEWHCDCEFFAHWNTCSHVMALQRILEPMLNDDARRAGSPFTFDEIAEAVG
ncbi:hypothetical protein [Herpetosiphon sp. NSE202]|uniref:hypothetical protein n=1 Tax=Herpetosiphon sp. NSE202 TaxID=3351349 RepID=UPI00362EAC31